MSLPALLVICLILLLMVGYFVWWIWKAGRNTKGLKERGVATTAEVLKQNLRFVSLPNGGNRTVYELNIRYTVGGKTYEDKVSVPENIYHSNPPHSRVEIVYLPENPKIVQVK